MLHYVYPYGDKRTASRQPDSLYLGDRRVLHTLGHSHWRDAHGSDRRIRSNQHSSGSHYLGERSASGNARLATEIDHPGERLVLTVAEAGELRDCPGLRIRARCSWGAAEHLSRQAHCGPQGGTPRDGESDSP